MCVVVEIGSKRSFFSLFGGTEGRCQCAAQVESGMHKSLTKQITLLGRKNHAYFSATSSSWPYYQEQEATNVTKGIATGSKDTTRGAPGCHQNGPVLADALDSCFL